MNTDQDEYAGPAAICQKVNLSALARRAAATVANWLVTSERFHPVWRQWSMYAVHLRYVTGVGEAKLHFAGATHEIGILALNPDTPVAVKEMGRPDWRMRYLLPINLAHQLTATDDEMRQVVALMAWSISEGHHSPEPLGSGGADSAWGQGWLASITKTLAHLRGEEHAS